MTCVAPPIKNDKITLERIAKFVSDKYFVDNNLRGRLYEDELNIEPIYRLKYDNKRIPFAQAVENFAVSSEVVKIGFTFGPTWTTEWFCFSLKIPTNWKGRRVYLVWDSQCEGMLWSDIGTPLTGLSSEVNRTDFCLSDYAVKSHTKIDDDMTFYVEVAGNELFGAGKDGFINAPDAKKTFSIKVAKLVVFRDDVYQLLMDFDIAIGLCKHLPADDLDRHELLYLANDVVNRFCKNPLPENILLLHEEIHSHLNRIDASKTTSFTVHAVANSHIDTAWLWPYSETRRKCARSWINALNLMDEYPELNFCCSQAQQLCWLKEDLPSLFAKLQEKAIEGRFIIVGGCWVEMDANLPGGESIVRQMLYGQQFFRENFSANCDVFWLPDTFGYCPQLPQLATSAGMPRFVTQKLSWNLVNKFPHNTFYWRGLDGTRLLTHFPPADTYNCRMSVEEFLKSYTNFKDKGRSKHSLMLYGHGDGGGGPDRHMVERLKRLKSAVRSIELKPSTPRQFFDEVTKETPTAEKSNLCTWDGELFLELHNGTYTTQAQVKKLNRTMEFLLRDVEFLSVLDFLSNGNFDHDRVVKFDNEWKKALLNQFHDVLPGTSIGLVYDDVRAIYKEVQDKCLKFLTPEIETAVDCVLNSLPWQRSYVSNGKLVILPPMSITPITLLDSFPVSQFEHCTIIEYDGNFTLRNHYLTVVVNPSGQLSELKVNYDENFSNFIDNNLLGNVFTLFEDVPLFWDAWDVMDYHLETRQPLSDIKRPWIKVNSKLYVSLVFEISIGSGRSSIEQEIILQSHEPFLRFRTRVKWHESRKMLKVEFPLNLRPLGGNAFYDTQFGFISRPTVRNTSWDTAKYEVCAQKWAVMQEYGRGFALLNDCKYGHSCLDNVLSLSLLRSPKAPDSNCDMSDDHAFEYAVMPFIGPFQEPKFLQDDLNVQRCSYMLNSPVRMCKRLTNSVFASFRVENKAVMLEAVKSAERSDREGAIIVRLFENFGGKCSTKFYSVFTIKKAYLCNLLEDEIEKIEILADDQNVESSYLNVSFGPFEVKTVKLYY